jgi:hypothetical protein
MREKGDGSTAMEQDGEKVATWAWLGQISVAPAATGLQPVKSRRNSPPPCFVVGRPQLVRTGVKINLNGLGSTADFSYSPCYEGRMIGHRTVP